MTHIIVGTAGHIDHGKTALVRGLTGIETDRLEEEKARGISIDLGFAHLDFPEKLRVGFVDVPGHERFVKNMLAGATGIDIVLFIVAADESVKPQTREHFEICRLLNIRHGIVVLTKADRADRERLDAARLEVEELTAGSFLDRAPVHEVSSVTGVGVEELKREIERMSQSVAQRNASGAFRLPVDRVFSMRGFGTVVTGTVVSGQIGLNDEVEIYPIGQRSRVRRIETHGQIAETAAAGQRAALNLVGVETTDLRRGMTIGLPGTLTATSMIGARLEMLSGAPALKSRTQIHFHAGTAEIEGEVRPLEEGSKPLAKIVLADPAVLLAGDRFILRRFSPVETIGGGIVVDPQPSARRREDLRKNLLALEAGHSLPDKAPKISKPVPVAEKPYAVSADLEVEVEHLFETSGLTVPALSELFLRSNGGAVRAAVYNLLNKKKLVRISPDFVVHSAAVERLREVLSARRGATFSIPEFKDWTGVSRKYAIPLLEYLDRMGYTRRDGDRRIAL